MHNYSGIIALLRIKHWIKNLFVMAPLIFSGLMTDQTAIINSIVAMFIFCIASSAAYTLNDLVDIDYDKRHPANSQTRPLANGSVSKRSAIITLIFLYMVIIISLVFYTKTAWVALIYILLNIAYSLHLKKIPIIDLFIIATGFMLRLYAGAVAIDVPLSAWMAVTTMSLALYLASIKRRQELIRSSDNKRDVASYYSVDLINRYAEISSTGAIVFYSMFVMSEKPDMIITIPFVIFGLFRYWYLVESHEQGESPTTTLLGDWQLIINLVIWSGCSIWVYYPH